MSISSDSPDGRRVVSIREARYPRPMESETSRGEALPRAELLRASPPMFESRLLDRFTRVHPAVPPLLFLPAIAVCATLAFLQDNPLEAGPGLVVGYEGQDSGVASVAQISRVSSTLTVADLRGCGVQSCNPLRGAQQSNGAYMAVSPDGGSYYVADGSGIAQLRAPGGG